MKLPDINLNWFDLIAVAALLGGLLRGRFRGMSEELLPLTQWLSIIFVGAVVYERGGALASQLTGWPAGYCHVGVYVLVAAAIKWLFAVLKTVLGDKLLTVNAFGKLEYWLGALGGLLRFAAVLVFAMSVLHGVYTEPSPKKGTRAAASPEALSFPTLGSIQEAVFQQSLFGKTVTPHLPMLLLSPVQPTVASAPPTPPGGAGEAIRSHRRDANEAISPK